jgi:hypothetical protein
MNIFRVFNLHRALPDLVGAYFVIASVTAFADGAKLTQSVADYEAASNELVALLQTAQLTPKTEATDRMIAAAYARQTDAEEAVKEAMQTLDPKSEVDGQLIEQAFAKIQAANQAVADAQIKASELQPAVESKRQ